MSINEGSNEGARGDSRVGADCLSVMSSVRCYLTSRRPIRGRRSFGELMSSCDVAWCKRTGDTGRLASGTTAGGNNLLLPFIVIIWLLGPDRRLVLSDSSRPNVRLGPSGRGRAPRVSPSRTLPRAEYDKDIMSARRGARRRGVGEWRRRWVDGLPRCMLGDGAGGESVTENDMDELNDWSTSAGKSTSVRVGDAAGEIAGESNLPQGKDSVKGEDEKASIFALLSLGDGKTKRCLERRGSR